MLPEYYEANTNVYNVEISKVTHLRLISKFVSRGVTTGAREEGDATGGDILILHKTHNKDNYTVAWKDE